MDIRETNHKWWDSFDEKRMVLTIEIDGDTMDIPAKYEVCPVCDGKGSHVNPSIDSNGLSAEDFAEDPDFREEYFSGFYDVRCYTCDGNRVTPTVDEERISKEDKELVDRFIQDHYDYQAEDARARRYGY